MMCRYVEPTRRVAATDEHWQKYTLNGDGHNHIDILTKTRDFSNFWWFGVRRFDFSLENLIFYNVNSTCS